MVEHLLEETVGVEKTHYKAFPLVLVDIQMQERVVRGVRGMAQMDSPRLTGGNRSLTC